MHIRVQEGEAMGAHVKGWSVRRRTARRAERSGSGPATLDDEGFARSSRRLAAILIAVAIASIGTWMILAPPTRLDRAPGRMVGDFALADVVTGRIHRLSEHRGRVVAIVFVGTSCPVGDLYLPRLIAMADAYRSRGVDFLAIDSNASEPDAEVAAYARAAGADFPFLKDPENRVADALLAERTCEAIVVDRRGRLRYRGAIDDQYTPGRRRDAPRNEYLAVRSRRSSAVAPSRPRRRRSPAARSSGRRRRSRGRPEPRVPRPRVRAPS